MSKDGRHYNPEKLHKWFAISSLVLLAVLGGLLMKDYDRDWKDYQKEFRRLEVEKTRVEHDKASIDLESDTAYQAILEEYENALTVFEKNCDRFHDLESEIESLKADKAIVQQKYGFTKAELDTAKYQFEKARAEGLDQQDEAKARFEKLREEEKRLGHRLEQLSEQIDSKEKTILDCAAGIQEVERKKRKAEQRKELLERKLQSIDSGEMSFANQIANMVRDLPIIDLANPTLKINQIVLKDLRDDVNFMTVPKVERCTTCHLGIANDDYVNAPQPFTTHPNLELYVGKDSPHPLEEYGCTVCHEGRPRGTSFITAAHTPDSAAEAERWKEEYDWHEMELWEDPMLPVRYSEAGCFKCHSGQMDIPGADKLNLGLNIIERAGCYNCHEIERYEDWPKSGPDLTHLASKMDKTWAYKWIEEPQAFRHNTWMPAYFHQSNNDDPESVARSQQEIHAIVHYLFENSEPFPLEPANVKGDPVRGEEIVSRVGCMGCHQIQPNPSLKKTTQELLRQQHGPNLIGLGTKTDSDWLFHWLKNPDRYHPETRMPNMRLTDQEAADAAAFLLQDQNDSFESLPVPSVNTKEMDELVMSFLGREFPREQAREKLTSMSQDEKLYFSGEKLISQYGCYSCHTIKGFEDAKPIGIALTEEGSKSVHKFDFGFLDIHHTRWDWFQQKLKDPRSFDKGKIKKAHEKLMMPNYVLSNTEIEAAVTALLGFQKTIGVKEKIYPRTPENLLKERGETLVRQMNCTSCHIIDNKGGDIRESVRDWLTQYKDMTSNDAEKQYESYSPPDLHGIGKKLNPEWLFNFIHRPVQKIRPWIEVRMPTYGFNETHLNLLVKYFATLDDEKFPFNIPEDTELSEKEFEAAEKMFSPDYFNCQQCHVVGNQLPSGTADSWAPNLALAKTRLDRDWIENWLKNPAELMPGTKMPAFWDPADFENAGPEDILDGDETRQIRVLRNYLLHITDKENPAPQTSPAQNPAPREPSAPQPGASSEQSSPNSPVSFEQLRKDLESISGLEHKSRRDGLRAM